MFHFYILPSQDLRIYFEWGANFKSEIEVKPVQLAVFVFSCWNQGTKFLVDYVIELDMGS